MTRSRVRLALSALLLGTGVAACPQYARQGPLVEHLSPEISPQRFRVVGTIAGGGSRTDLQLSAAVRQQLTDTGITVFRLPGRWETQLIAVRDVCAPTAAPSVDGVLFVWYNRLELYDCATQRAAYEVSGGTVGIQGMTKRLVAYLRRDAPRNSTE